MLGLALSSVQSHDFFHDFHSGTVKRIPNAAPASSAFAFLGDYALQLIPRKNSLTNCLSLL